MMSTMSCLYHCNLLLTLFFFNNTPTTEIYTLSLHDALPILKTVLITGANKGIGREVARQLATKGLHAFVGARNAKAGCKAAEEIANRGAKATFLEIDVADNDSVTNAAREFSNIEDHLDVLVYNAGII